MEGDPLTEEQTIIAVATGDVGTSPTSSNQEVAVSEQIIMVCDSIGTQTSSAGHQTLEMLNIGQPITFIPAAQGAATVVIGSTDDCMAESATMMEVEGEEELEGVEEERAVNTVAVQANDYEIERRSGRNPARQRIIPFKFRDLFDAEVSDEEKKDKDYDPDSERTTGPKKPGRPRKYRPGERKIQEIISTPKGYKCGHCSKLFTQKGNLKVHLLIHSGVKPFPCDEAGCNRAFRSKESLRRHKMAHQGIKPFECKVCSNKFCSQTALQEHMSRHSDSKPHTCQVCGRSFRQTSCLRRHLITHSSIKPFPCNVCGRHFSQMIYLRSHMKTHTGERPFMCDRCSKSFAHQTDLTRHRIIHTGEKPFKCNFCEAKFSDPSSCRRHIKDHTNDKSYECQHCGEKYKRAGQLRKHLNKHHGGGKLEVIGDNGTTYSIELHNPGSKDGRVEQIDWSTEENQRKIVSLIKNIPGLMVQQVEITTPDGLTTTQEVATVTTEEDSMQISTVPVEESTTTLIAEAVREEESQVVVEAGDITSAERELGGGEKTVIAITKVGGEGEEGVGEGALPMSAYQIIQGLAQEAGTSQQVFEVHVRSASPSLQVSPKNEVSIEESAAGTEPSQSETAASFSDPSVVDYVAHPDFGSQDYYNWLSIFTDKCKGTTLPLDVSLFQRISQVHKSLSDFMATPSGVIADRENFRELMNISRDLNAIISEHLSFVLSSLKPDPS